MGRGKRGRGNRGGDRDGGGRGGGRGGRGGREPRWGTRSQNVRQRLDEVGRTNDKFEQYYSQLVVKGDEDGEKFWQAMKSDLPNSFRFTGSRGHALTVQRTLIDRYIPDIVSVEYEGQKVSPPTPVEWYPDRLAWSMTTPKNVIRKFPPFASFQKFLVSENSVGNITRQEIVSMIPPLMMDVRPGMTVLDMCAAPGSKSTQIIELLHAGEEARVRNVLRQYVQEQGREASPDDLGVKLEKEHPAANDDSADDGRATGLFVANDSDYRRAHMLIHQCKRLNSPNLIVTNHDATLFPSIKIPSASDRKYLKFDRILADVPCSGDGTCRKNVAIWKDWTPGNALGLHALQQRILVRALQMLKVGGRVVYSTCSLNPVENEAVVAHAINRCGGSDKVEIVNVSDQLPGLERRPGLLDWPVMDKKGKIWSNWAELTESEELVERSKLSQEMFSPGPENNIALDRCVRVYPHLQDTGGFFITVLEKKQEIRAKPENEEKPPKTPAFPPNNSEPTTNGSKENHAADSAPVTAIANEIEERNASGAEPLEKIDAVDTLLPPEESVFKDVDIRDASAAARQNMENPPQRSVSPSKRALDEEVDAEMASKRLKIRDQIDEAAPEGMEDRLVHYPPPPSAGPDLTAHADPPQNTSNKRQPYQPQEESFKFLDPDHEELQKIYKFYSLPDRFPKDRFMVRNPLGDPVKAIYYTSSLARDILRENEGKGFKFVHCGVKMFVKQDVQGQDACRWRIQAEGLSILQGWVGEERVVRLTKKATLKKLLIEMFPLVSKNGWKELGEIGERVKNISMGCCVLRVEPSDSEDGFDEKIVLPLWKGQSSLNLMLPKEDRKAMLLRLYNDESSLVNFSQGQKRNENVTSTQGGENDIENDIEISETATTGVAGEEDEEQATRNPTTTDGPIEENTSELERTLG